MESSKVSIVVIFIWTIWPIHVHIEIVVDGRYYSSSQHCMLFLYKLRFSWWERPRVESRTWVSLCSHSLFLHLQTHEREDTSEGITGKPMLVLVTVFWTSILHRSFSWHSRDRRPPTQTKMPALYSDFSIKCCTILITVFWSWRQSPLPFQSVHFWHLAIDKKNEA